MIEGVRAISAWMAACLAFWSATATAADVARDYVGRAACAECHAAQTRAWASSHHAHSMEEARADTVLGEFSNTIDSDRGVTTRFSRRDGAYLIETRGPDGGLHEYRVRYTFGVAPLQQYLVELPGGRLQAFGLAWDGRTKSEGGQRWFSLSPGEIITPGDSLHWSGRDQNWNFMCAECHSTGLRKNYDLASDTFRTRWSDVNVACEACHGPGSAHVAWARRGAPALADKGLASPRADAGHWGAFDARGIRRWTGEPRDPRRAEICFPCHSRRRALFADPDPRRPFLDGYAPSLLDEGLFRADGQIDDEVFEYASFLQSRMYRAGVTCIDCHEPHGASLRASGNGLCAQCHDAARFDDPRHHHHRSGAMEARCVSCHMPKRTYMQIHDRRDHGFRVPRPDLSGALGLADSCGQCHSDRPASWAAAAMKAWGAKSFERPSAASAIAVGRRGAPGAAEALAAVAADEDESTIMRATALSLLARAPGPTALKALAAAILSPEPLIRLGAARGLEPYDLSIRGVASPVLADPARAPRVEAQRLLAGAGAAAEEWVAAELAAAERPETHLNIGALRAEQGRAGEAETAFATALRLDPKFTAALLDLADLYRSLGRDAEAEAPLRQAVAIDAKDAGAHYALGLWLLRQKRGEEGRAELARAFALAPTDAQIARAYRLSNALP